MEGLSGCEIPSRRLERRLKIDEDWRSKSVRTKR